MGTVRKPHGVHGDVLVDIETDFPERLAAGVHFGLGDGSGPHEFFQVHDVRYHKGSWLLSVKDVRQRTLVEAWRGRFVFLPEQRLDQLPEGYIYEHHLVGMGCVSPAGDELGQVIGLDQGPGQARLVVRRGRREYLVPFVPQIVTSVDREAGRVVVDAPPGLLDDDGAVE